MEFGQYLRNCRESVGRTQPEIASEVEIEQSYLSKLESGKSIPSNDVFNKLVDVYQIDVEKLVDTLSTQEQHKLREIKAISQLVSKKKLAHSNFSKRLAITGLVMLTLGAGLLGFSMLPDRSQTTFSYRSEGVLALNEDLDTFELVYRNTRTLEGEQQLLLKRTELLERLQQEDRLTTEFKGDGFLENSATGRRFFKLIGKNEPVRDYWNRWFLVPAFMMLVGGLGCCVVSWRWNRK